MAADGNGDGEISAGDYTVWKANHGATGAGLAVPEPATLRLLAVAVVVLGRLRLIAVGSRLGIFIAVLFAISLATAAVTNDRNYQMGDDGDEHAVLSDVVGSSAGNVNPGSTLDTAVPPGRLSICW